MFLGLRPPTSESLLTLPISQQEVSAGLIIHWKIKDLGGGGFKHMDALFLALQSKLSKSDCFWQEAAFRNLPPS